MNTEKRAVQVLLVVDDPAYLEFHKNLVELLSAASPNIAAHLLLLHQEFAEAVEDGATFLRVDASPEPQHTYDYAGITGYEQFLSGWEDLYEGQYEQAARGYAAQSERFFATHPTDCAVVWSGTRLASRAVATVARALGIPVVTLESAYFQKLPEPPEQDLSLDLHRIKHRVLIMDTLQAPQCGPSQLSRDWRNAQTRPGLQAFFEQLHAERSAKFSQQDIHQFLAGNTPVPTHDSPEALLFKPPHNRALLVLGQVSRDSARYFGDHLIDDWYELGLQTARQLPPGWILWFKGHPLDRRFAENAAEFARELHDLNPRARLLPPTLDIHACYQRCDAVATINSTATLEAVTYGLPVINFGWAAFTDIGMTWKLTAVEELRPLLQRLPPCLTPEQEAIRDQFLSYVLYDYLVPVGSPRRFVARILEAAASATA